MHYLIVNTSRTGRGASRARLRTARIGTRIAASGALALDPPGIELAVESLFPDQD